LDDILFGGQQQQSLSSSRVVRVCPETTCILKVEHVGVAHALIMGAVASSVEQLQQQQLYDTSTDAMMEPMQHLHIMTQICRATETMPLGNHLLVSLQQQQQQLGAEGQSISVHPAIIIRRRSTTDKSGADGSSSSDDDVEIDLEKEFPNMDAVYMGTRALQQCIRPWEWTDMTRVPYTFPVARDDDDHHQPPPQKKKARHQA
jgi:hypothetical protein